MHQGKASRNKLASNVAETEIRRRRLIQTCFAASLGLFAALFFCAQLSILYYVNWIYRFTYHLVNGALSV